MKLTQTAAPHSPSERKTKALVARLKAQLIELGMRPITTGSDLLVHQVDDLRSTVDLNTMSGHSRLFVGDTPQEASGHWNAIDDTNGNRVNVDFLIRMAKDGIELGHTRKRNLAKRNLARA